MLRKLKLFTVFLAWLLATGAQWDLLQVVAWGNMFLSNTESMSVGDALEKTFDGEECELCKAVRNAKQQENPPGLPGEKRITKVILICQPVSDFCYLSPESADWSYDQETMTGVLRPCPPVPPPRAA
jgi:hypothetical protein